MTGIRQFCQTFFFLIAIGMYSTPSLASRSFGAAPHSPWSVTFDAGPEYMLHYVKSTSLSTPPDLLLAQGFLAIWFKRQIGLYFYGAYSANESSLQYGGGLKVTLLEFRAGKVVGPNVARPGLPFFDRLSIQAAADYGKYSMAPPPSGYSYATEGTLPRVGGSLELGLLGSGLYTNLTVMLANFSNNLFLCPYLGLGVGF